MRFAAFATLWILASLVSPAMAQQGGTATQPSQQALPPALLPLLTTPDHRAALLRAAHAVDPPGTPACPDANYVTTGDVGILVPPKVDASGKPTEGVWKESIRVDGCGPERILNAMTQVQSNGTLQTSPLLPGTTIADPQLQRDSVQYAAAGMGSMPSGCNQGGVVNTQFVGVDGQPPGTPQPANAAAKPWTEIWTLEACGKRAEVRMSFTPDATGTAIHAAPVSS